MKKFAFILALMELAWLSACGQLGDTLPSNHVLNEVLIARGYDRDVINTEDLQMIESLSLGQYLQNNGYCQIQAHGPDGTMMSMRHRGMSSDYTTIYWNDIPLNSITHGGMDVSLIPLFFIDEIENDRMNNQTTRQWNNVNNGLYLRSSARNANTKTHIRLVEAYSTLNNATHGIEYSWNYKQKLEPSQQARNPWLLGGTSRAFYQRLHNEFTYVDTYTLDKRLLEQAHNNGDNMGWLQTLYASKGDHRLEWDVWLQNKSMHLPMLMGQTGHSSQEQDDGVHRMSIRYLYTKKNVLFKSSLAENQERMDYRDLLQADGNWLVDSRLVAKSRFWNNTAQFVVRNTWSFGLALLGVQQVVDNSNYGPDGLRQNWLQLAGDGAWHFGAHTLSFGARREFRPVYTATNWNLSYLLKGPIPRIGARFQFQAQLARKFRTPDLNDLYWVPGGNLKLRSEEGYTADAHIHFDWNLRSRLNLTSHASIYCTDLNDMIVWMPGAGLIWSPVNLSKVRSRGIDAFTTLSLATTDARWSVVCRSQINESLSEGKVVPYMPRQIHAIQTKCSWHQWRFEINGTYTAQRFTEAENKWQLALEANWLFGGLVGRSFSWRQQSLDATFGVVNAMNVAYQSVRGYAMPGRYWQVQIGYQFIKPQKTNEKEDGLLRELIGR